MRLRKRHAWSAVLVVLFALPIVRPEGFPGFEGSLDAGINWFARSGVGNPHAWGAPRTPSADETARERDLVEMYARFQEFHLTTVEEMRQQLGLKETLGSMPRLPLALPARVLRAHDAAPPRMSILIDRGTADGVREGLAVVEGGVLVGIVRHAEPYAARVQLVTDPRFKLEVAVRTQEGARGVGFLVGGGETVPLKHLRGRDGLHVRPGDPVLSSNADENVPAGLVVGRVVAGDEGGADSFLEVTARPLLDVERTLTVLVLLPAK